MRVAMPAARPARSRGPETRRRILRSAEALIAAQGIHLIKMTDISSHAGVSERTLYNIFSTKNDLVSELVSEYQRALLGKIGRDRFDSLEAIMRSINGIALDLERNRRWAEAIAHLYFQPDVAPEIHRNLYAISLRHFDMSIEVILKRPDVRQTALHKMLRHQFANTGYALVHDLAMGRIDGPELGQQLGVALEVSLAALARSADIAIPVFHAETDSRGEGK